MQIKQRLHQLLNLLNQNRNNKITISELAEFIGYTKTGDLDKYFFGLEEPSNEEKERICFCLGVNPDWLKHGKGEPFGYQKPYEYYAENYLKFIKSQSPKEIIFVRSRGEDGKAGIIVRLNEFKYVLLQKTWNISGRVDSGGEKQIYSFYKLVKELQKWRETSYKFQDMNIKGNHLEKKEFNDLTCGRIYPASVIKFSNDTWWDDLTDINHVWSCAPSYEKEHGNNFIEAQEIIKYRHSLNNTIE